MAQNEAAFNQQQALADLRTRIGAQKNQPAEAVFKNIQIHKGVPAERLLAIMEIGYSRSLGVTCVHCHVPGQWDSEEKPTKQITREMTAMASSMRSI